MMMAVCSESPSLQENQMQEIKAIAASWARSFLAAGIATYLAVGWDAPAIVNAALVASLPVILRYLNPNDPAFGRR